MMKKLTPVIFVPRIEPCLSFWTDRLGFERTIEVPEEDHLGFAALKKDAVEVMYQTWKSLEDDLPEAAAEAGPSRAFLFIEVESADQVAEAMEGADWVIPRRTTFYGADEIVVRAPCGTVVTFAEFGAGEE